jgi:hypothetical protein
MIWFYILFIVISGYGFWVWKATPSNLQYPEGQVLIDHLDVIQRELHGIIKVPKWGVWTYSDNVSDSPNFTDLGKEGVRQYLNNSNTSVGEGVPSWRVFPLIHEGDVFYEASRRCPMTIKILKQFGNNVINAGFSCMESGSRTPVHKDNDKRFYRMHIPIIVPSDSDGNDLGLRVAGRVLRWTVGKYFVFDDTYTHQAWNDTKGIRIVLLVDIKRK